MVSWDDPLPDSGALNQKQKDSICSGYTNQGHWDTILYTNAKAFETPICPKGPGCGFDNKVPGAKGGMPVWAFGACWASYDVNYILYGRMMRNCGNSRSALFWFNLYKDPLYTEHTKQRYTQARGWIKAGFTNVLDVLPPTNLKPCAKPGDTFTGTIRWYVIGDNNVSIRG